MTEVCTAYVRSVDSEALPEKDTRLSVLEKEAFGSA
jgi:hypothetical protein